MTYAESKDKNNTAACGHPAASGCSLAAVCYGCKCCLGDWSLSVLNRLLGIRFTKGTGYGFGFWHALLYSFRQQCVREPGNCYWSNNNQTLDGVMATVHWYHFRVGAQNYLLDQEGNSAGCSRLICYIRRMIPPIRYSICSRHY